MIYSVETKRPAACVAGSTNRSELAASQDYVGAVENLRAGISAVLVADGLGAFEHSEMAARRAVETAISRLESIPSLGELDFTALFRECQNAVRELACKHCADTGLQLDFEHSFGTTMIVGVDTPEELLVAYVGNGSAWHLRGNFNHFGANRYIPWSAVNYLNPHTLENNLGREALYRLISPSNDDKECAPTVVRISKDSVQGDILLVCTDGISSLDQAQVGKYRDGSVWTRAEDPVLRFYTALAEYFQESHEFTGASLKSAMNRYLDELRSKGLLDDDASLGLILTPDAVAYQRVWRGTRSAEQG